MAVPPGLPGAPGNLDLKIWSRALPLWLHRSHGSDASRAAPKEAPSLAGHDTVAQAAASSAAFAGGSPEEHCGVSCWIEDLTLCAASKDGVPVALVNLFLADASCAPLPMAGPKRLNLLALVPPLNQWGLRGTVAGGEDMDRAPVWYVVLQDADMDKLDLLDELSQLGCFRGGLEQAYKSAPAESSTFGQGANATVRCMFDRSGKAVAVKKMNAVMELDAIEREVATLLQVQRHPHVMGYHGIFWAMEDVPRLSLVFEAAGLGDILNRVLHEGVLTEQKARQLFSGTMQGLVHVHSHGIVHRDIKAENILLVDSKQGERAMVADFGLATWLTDEKQMARRCGSPGYVAPEVCVGTPYGLNADVFGAGVVLYFMLSKEMPFASRDRDTAATMRKTVKCALHLHRPPWDSMSSRLRSMLRETICKSPDDRLSAAGALAHPWLQGKSSSRSAAPADLGGRSEDAGHGLDPGGGPSPARGLPGGGGYPQAGGSNGAGADALRYGRGTLPGRLRD